MSNLQIKPARSNQLQILENLFQFYLYDFDDYLLEGVDDRGLFSVDIDLSRYFRQAGRRDTRRWAYFAIVDHRLAGFSLISDQVDYQDEGRYVDEFFLLRQYRGKGLGKAMAFQTFDLHRGYWEVVAIGPNVPAQGFWRHVIREYTGGDHQEFETEEDGERLVWQTFDSSK